MLQIRGSILRSLSSTYTLSNNTSEVGYSKDNTNEHDPFHSNLLPRRYHDAEIEDCVRSIWAMKQLGIKGNSPPTPIFKTVMVITYAHSQKYEYFQEYFSIMYKTAWRHREALTLTPIRICSSLRSSWCWPVPYWIPVITNPIYIVYRAWSKASELREQKIIRQVSWLETDPQAQNVLQ